MTKLALTFIILAIIAAILGFGYILGDSSWIAEILFFICIVLFILTLVIDYIKRIIRQ
jgi:uncharacterized membrane protein YtjA (UPF0391 family)